MSNQNTKIIISSRALNVMRAILLNNGGSKWDAERCLTGLKEEVQAGRLTFEGGHLRHNGNFMTNCGKTTSLEIWQAIEGTSDQSDQLYTARVLDSERIGILMPGREHDFCEYVLSVEEAQKLKNSLHDALPAVNTMRFSRAQEEEASEE